MNFRVHILRRAEVDVDTIYLWIAKRAAGGAAHWYQAFLVAAASLRIQPTRNALAPEAAAVGRDIRQLLFKTRRGRKYRLLYLVDGNDVKILRVRGPGEPPVTHEDVGD
jgi:plasmid stabilization system protein ParE